MALVHATVSYLPWMILAGSITILIILAMGSIGLAGSSSRRKRIRWQSGPTPPLPDPDLGANPRELRIADERSAHHEVRLRDGDPPLGPHPGENAEN